MMHNFIAYILKGSDFYQKNLIKQNEVVNKLHSFTFEPYKGITPTSSSAN